MKFHVTHLYKSYPAAKALPLVGALPLSDNFLTCSGTDPATAAAAAAAAVDVSAATDMLTAGERPITIHISFVLVLLLNSFVPDTFGSPENDQTLKRHSQILNCYFLDK